MLSALLGCLTTAPVAAEVANCRTQVIYACSDVCTAEAGFADISLDLEKLTGDFCRGESCVQGSVKLTRVTGTADSKDYVMFLLKGSDPGFSVSGVIDSDFKRFAADSDELGRLFGTCEKTPAK